MNEIEEFEAVQAKAIKRARERALAASVPADRLVANAVEGLRRQDPRNCGECGEALNGEQWAHEACQKAYFEWREERQRAMSAD